MRLVFVFCLLLGAQLALAQTTWDEAAFARMQPAERFRAVHNYPFWQYKDGKSVSEMLNRMAYYAEQNGDRRSQLAIQYYLCLCSGLPGFERPDGKDNSARMNDLYQKATQWNYPVEKWVACFYQTNDQAAAQRISDAQHLLRLQEVVEMMRQRGFEQFQDYNIAGILFSYAQLLWGMDDREGAFRILCEAEQLTFPDQEGLFHRTQIYSYLQEYWKRHKNYSKSIAYAHKILQEQAAAQAENAEDRWNIQFWMGFANIEIAAIMIETEQYAAGEAYADQGYRLLKMPSDFSNKIVQHQAEFDALMVLIPIRLQLGKTGDAAALLQRATLLRDSLQEQGQFDYFKSIKLFRHNATLLETQGQAAGALKFLQRAETLQDSLNRKNDAHRLAQEQRRLEAQRYAERLQLVEAEKEFQVLLRNIALLVLLLVIALAYVIFRLQQNKRRLVETKLEAARNTLQVYTDRLKEKSAQSERLHAEIERLAEEGRQNDYLQQLSEASILTEDDWQQFRALFEKVHPGFIAGKKQEFPELTNAELRFLVLEKLGFSPAEMASMLGVNKNTIYQTRLRLRKKAE